MKQALEKRSMLTLDQHLYIKTNNIHQTFLFVTHAYTTGHLCAPLTFSDFLGKKYKSG